MSVKTPVNAMTVSLIKTDGVNILKGKGRFDPSRKKTIEVRRKLLWSTKEVYLTDPTHAHIEISKRNKPHRMLFFIDLKTNKSIDMKNHVSSVYDGMTKNFMNHLSEEAFWKQYGHKEMKRSDRLIHIFAGMGILFLIIAVAHAVGVLVL